MKWEEMSGADRQIRTADLTLTKGALYQLSHISNHLKMERTARIELAALAWKAKVLPLYDVRTSCSQTITSKKWWRGQDSNLRRLSRQIYSLIPLTAWVPLQIDGADYRSRTGDLLITSQLLYQLS